MSTVVMVNNRSCTVDQEKPLSYRDVATLAGSKLSALPDVTYHTIPGAGGHTMRQDDTVVPIAGMIFNVSNA